MRQILLLSMLFLLATSCQDKKYDPDSYKVEAFENSSNSSRLLEECLTFMNYCDKNKSTNVKRFARDWLRTYEGWETDGVKDYIGVQYCHISTKSKYNVKSISVSLYTDSIPPVFEAERGFYSTEYEDLVVTIRAEFGHPDEIKEGRDGTIYKWHINDVKTISTIPNHFGNSFNIEYRLTE